MHPTLEKEKLLNKCLICFIELKGKTFHTKLSSDPQKLYDISCKYLHTEITKELVANRSYFSSRDEFPLVCEKCCSSAVQLIDLADKLEYFQKRVAESTLVFSLEILNRRRESTVTANGTRNLKKETSENPGIKLLEFDVSIFPDCKFDSPASLYCSPSLSLLESYENLIPDTTRDVCDPFVVTASGNDIQIPVSNVIKFENIYKEAEGCNIENETIFRQINTSQATDNNVNPEPSILPFENQPEKVDVSKKHLVNVKSLPVLKLKRLDPGFISKATKGEINLSELNSRERISAKISYTNQPNYITENEKLNTKEPKSTSVSKKCRRYLPRRQLGNLPDRCKTGRPKKLATVTPAPLPLQNLSHDSSTPTMGNVETNIRGTAIATGVQLQIPVKKNIRNNKGTKSTICDNRSFRKRKTELPKKLNSIYVLDSKLKHKRSYIEKGSHQRRKLGPSKRNRRSEQYSNRFSFGDQSGIYPRKMGRPQKSTSSQLPSEGHVSSDAAVKNSDSVKIEVVEVEITTTTTTPEMQKEAESKIEHNTSENQPCRRRKIDRPIKKVPNTVVLKAKPRKFVRQKKLHRLFLEHMVTKRK